MVESVVEGLRERDGLAVDAGYGAVVTVFLSVVPFSSLLGGAVAAGRGERGYPDGFGVGLVAGVFAAVPLVALFDALFERQRKQEEAEFERALYRIVVDEFVDARTEQELEAGVVEGLARRGHDLAWIGTVDGADINSRAVGGDREFFATLGSALAEPREGAEPFVRAARTGEGQYLGDIETLLSAEWRDAALDAGYRSAIAVPLSYHDVSYGVLAVYSREPDRFGERERHRRSCSRVTSSEAARRSPDAIVVFRCGTLAVVSDFRFWKRE